MGDTEADHMYNIARILFDILSKDPRLNTYIVSRINTGSDIANLRESVKLSNTFIKMHGGKGYHLELHSDAGAYAKGASGLYYSESGRQFVEPIMKELTDLTPWTDVGLKQRRDLLALKGTVATAGLIEVSFHDNLEEAKFIHENVVPIAVRIANGFYKYLKGVNLI